ncbi:hypothetical protein LguiB_006694 [Lonicera macranthoides]
MEVLKKLKDGGKVEEKDKDGVIFGDLNDKNISKENDISLLEEIDFTAIQLEAISKVLYPDVDEQAMKIEPHSQIQMKCADLNLDVDERKNLIDGEPNNPSCGDQSFNVSVSNSFNILDYMENDYNPTKSIDVAHVFIIEKFHMVNVECIQAQKLLKIGMVNAKCVQARKLLKFHMVNVKCVPSSEAIKVRFVFKFHIVNVE